MIYDFCCFILLNSTKGNKNNLIESMMMMLLMMKRVATAFVINSIDKLVHVNQLLAFKSVR